MLNDVLWNKQVIIKKLQTYYSIVKRSVTYGAETWEFNKRLGSKLTSMKIDFLGDQRDTEIHRKI